MSRYQPYPSYKQGDIEWLGEIPEHWEVGLLSSLFVDNKEKNAGIKNNNLLSLSYGRIIQKDIDTNEGLLPESFESYQIVHSGYIVLRLTDLQNDKKSLRTGFVKETGIITSAYTGLAKKSKSIGDERYFHLYLHTFDLHKGFYGMGAGVRQGLNFDELKKLKFLLPPTNEQTLIADFLDRETAKIDTLIIKQERMIELLNEKRSTIISHAVTKGIDPNVKMKDSGTEWLGEVPGHWEVSPLKYLLSEPLMYGANESADRDDPNDPRYIRITDIKSDGTLHSHTFKSLPISIAAPYLLKTGAILLARSGGTVGKSFLYDDSWGVACFAGYLIKAAINQSKAFAKFIYYFTMTPNYWQWLASAQIQATIENVSAEKYASLTIPIPSLSEQEIIINYLDTQTAKIDTLIAKARQAIELMKERRTALISAAVTGKIDVKGIA